LLRTGTKSKSLACEIFFTVFLAAVFTPEVTTSLAAYAPILEADLSPDTAPLAALPAPFKPITEVTALPKSVKSCLSSSSPHH
jgi:hypothetical protein